MVGGSFWVLWGPSPLPESMDLVFDIFGVGPFFEWQARSSDLFVDPLKSHMLASTAAPTTAPKYPPKGRYIKPHISGKQKMSFAFANPLRN